LQINVIEISFLYSSNMVKISISNGNRYERTPLDEAVSRGKQDVVDAIVTATAASSLATSTVEE
jgi:hypothetical protein